MTTYIESTSLIVSACEAVVDALNSAPPGTFTIAFQAELSYSPLDDLQDLADLSVVVVPGRHRRQRATRTQVQRDLTVSIGIRQKINIHNPDQTRRLIAFSEAVADYLQDRGLSLPLAGAAVPVEIETDVPYLHEHMQRMGQFTSFLNVTYRVQR